VRLEELYFYESVKKGMAKQGFMNHNQRKFRDCPHMKKLCAAWSNDCGEWYQFYP